MSSKYSLVKVLWRIKQSSPDTCLSDTFLIIHLTNQTVICIFWYVFLNINFSYQTSGSWQGYKLQIWCINLEPCALTLNWIKSKNDILLWNVKPDENRILKVSPISIHIKVGHDRGRGKFPLKINLELALVCK